MRILSRSSILSCPAVDRGINKHLLIPVPHLGDFDARFRSSPPMHGVLVHENIERNFTEWLAAKESSELVGMI